MPFILTNGISEQNKLVRPIESILHASLTRTHSLSLSISTSLWKRKDSGAADFHCSTAPVSYRFYMTSDFRRIGFRDQSRIQECPIEKEAGVLHATYIWDQPATPHFNLEPEGLCRHLLPVHSCPPSIYAAGKRACRKNKPARVGGRVPSLTGLYITTSARRYNVWKAIT